MAGMDAAQMAAMGHGASGAMNMQLENFIQEILLHSTSGTSAEPDSTPIPMLSEDSRPWTLMFHANVFILDNQQSSLRGGDKFFSTNWFMGMAQRPAGPGVLTLRTMLTLEPATITDRRYPLLFQQGETAYGVPIADGQHPHNFFMELASLYDWKLGAKDLLSFYLAPVAICAGPGCVSPRCLPQWKILSAHSAITRRIQPTSQPMWSRSVSRIASRGSKHQVFTAASRVRIGGRLTRVRSTRGLRASPCNQGKTGVGNIPTASITSPEALSPAENQNA